MNHIPPHYQIQKRSSKRSKVPRKGRIRVVILFLLVAIVLRFFLFSAAGEGDSTEPEVQDVAVDSAVTEEKVSTSKEVEIAVEAAVKERVEERVPESLQRFFSSQSSIDSLATLFPPSVTNSRDTVIFSGRSLVREFSIDTALTDMADLYMRRYAPIYGSIVVLNPESGRVLSMVEYSNPENDSTVDYLEGPLYSRAHTPAASVAKLITATAAIEVAGMSSRTPIAFNGRANTLLRAQLEPTIENSRTESLREAFAHSTNPVFGRLGLFNLGSANIFAYAQKYGFNAPIPFELPVEKSNFIYPENDMAVAEAASGFIRTTTLTPLLGGLMAGAVSQGGEMYAPTLTDRVIDLSTGEVLIERKPRLWRIACGAETARELQSLMEDVTLYGTAKTSFDNVRQNRGLESFVYGGKTGSLSLEGVGSTDWFIGYMKHHSDPRLHLAVGIYLVHTPRWTVRSPYIAAETMRRQLVRMQSNLQE